MEDAQILENKWTCLQRLIDMFAHQSDAFLLNHKPTEDVPMTLLGDYSEYDNADDIDKFGVPANLDKSPSIPPHRSHTNSGSRSNAEDILLLLPSTLGWDWCIQRGLKVLANKEAKLHFAQATDSIHKICLVLGFKSALFWTQVRHSWTQKTKSRAWTAVHSVDASVHEHSRNYSMARDAYLKILDLSRESSELPLLQLADLRVNTTILGAAEVGQRNQRLLWIWSFGTSTKQDETWMDDCECSPIPENLTNTQRWNSQQGSLAPSQGTV